MSYFDTKQAFIQQLLTVVNEDDIAFPNDEKDFSSRPFFYAVFFNPVTTESTGKTLESSDQNFGFFQTSVFVPRNSGNYDNVLFQKVDLIIKTAFRNTTSITYNNQVVNILGSTVNQPVIEYIWYKTDITTNYLTFSER